MSGTVVSLWSTNTVDLLNRLPGQDPYLFSPNGQILAVANNGQLDLWDLSQGYDREKIRHYGPSLEMRGEALAFSPNNEKLAVAGQKTLVRLFDLAKHLNNRGTP